MVYAKNATAATTPARVANVDVLRALAPLVFWPVPPVGDAEPEVLPPVRVGEPEEDPAVGPDFAAEPEAEPELDAPEGVGSAAKSSDDWKVTQFDEEGMGAVNGIEVIGPRDSGGSE